MFARGGDAFASSDGRTGARDGIEINSVERTHCARLVWNVERRVVDSVSRFVYQTSRVANVSTILFQYTLKNWFILSSRVNEFVIDEYSLFGGGCNLLKSLFNSQCPWYSVFHVYQFVEWISRTILNEWFKCLLLNVILQSVESSIVWQFQSPVIFVYWHMYE